jgi:hypothetical protein
MSAKDIVLGADSGGAATPTYVDDVFSTYLYTGNGSTQTINNGIDLAGKGGMVWSATRVGAENNGPEIIDTNRGGSYRLLTSLTQAAYNCSDPITFNTNGFSMSPTVNTYINYSGFSKVAWTFRKAAKFFDVVTYTGNGVAGRQIAHSLGVAPGMIIVKRTDDYGNNWWVYHRSLGALQGMSLNTTDAVNASGGDVLWNNTEPTPTVFTLGVNGGVNASGGTYVAYIFAHDTSADGLIQCGSFTTDNNCKATVNLGWEPQWILYRNISSPSRWIIADSMRGMPTNPAIYLNGLYPNTSDAEDNGENRVVQPTSTGFNVNTFINAQSIYMAIRRPNKPPTSGTQVYNAFLSNTVNPGGVPKFLSNFPVDMFMFGPNIDSAMDRSLHPRLTQGKGLTTSSTAVEEGGSNYSSSLKWDYNIGVHDGGSFYPGTPDMGWMFKRAPGFFDVVCYTGTGVANSSFNHNLGVRPELMIIKARTSTSSWITAANITATTYSELYLDTTQAQVTGSPMAYSDGNATIGAAPTATTFGFGYPYGIENASATNYVAYLFATLAGISKVGSYTGNGSSQTINCGFAAGARFILIKRTDAAGDWYVWDTTRGIAAANDPHLSLNTTAAEVTTDDSIDPDSTGFIVNQVAATNINVTSATYIYLAIS